MFSSRDRVTRYQTYILQNDSSGGYLRKKMHLKGMFHQDFFYIIWVNLLNNNSYVLGDIWKTVGKASWPLFYTHMWPCDLQEIYHPHIHVCSEERDLWQKGHMNFNIVLCVSLRFSPILDLWLHTWILEGKKVSIRSLNGHTRVLKKQ